MSVRNWRRRIAGIIRTGLKLQQRLGIEKMESAHTSETSCLWLMKNIQRRKNGKIEVSYKGRVVYRGDYIRNEN